MMLEDNQSGSRNHVWPIVSGAGAAACSLHGKAESIHHQIICQFQGSFQSSEQREQGEITDANGGHKCRDIV